MGAAMYDKQIAERLAATMHTCGAMRLVDHNTVRTCTRLTHEDPVHVHERPGHRVVWEDPRPDRPADCTCSGWHTDNADTLSDAVLQALIDMPGECPAERRALARILASRP